VLTDILRPYSNSLVALCPKIVADVIVWRFVHIQRNLVTAVTNGHVIRPPPKSVGSGSIFSPAATFVN
jgi:hypothetical protein